MWHSRPPMAVSPLPEVVGEGPGVRGSANNSITARSLPQSNRDNSRIAQRVPYRKMTTHGNGSAPSNHCRGAQLCALAAPYPKPQNLAPRPFHRFFAVACPERSRRAQNDTPSVAHRRGRRSHITCPRCEIRRVVKSFTAFRTAIPAFDGRHPKRAFLAPTAARV